MKYTLKKNVAWIVGEQKTVMEMSIRVYDMNKTKKTKAT